MRTQYLFLLVFSLLILGCNNSSDTSITNDDSVVRIFVAWPGAEARPHYYWPKGEDSPKGIEPELIELILQEANLKYEYVPDFHFSGNGDPRIKAIVSGAADISIRGISITEERKASVLFSDPYYIDGLSALVRDTSKISSVNDLKDKRVYAHSYTTAYDWSKKNLPNSELYTYDNFPSIDPERLLLMDSIDAYLIDYTFLKYLEKQTNGVKVLDEKFTSEPLAIAVSKNNVKLLDKINVALKDLNTSGKLEEIVKRFEKQTVQ